MTTGYANKAMQGVVKHGRWNGYGAPDLCVIYVFHRRVLLRPGLW
jgi:hypothetical protein